ncbi:hypothetical protein D9611_012091 [Ephemerocybe angulata]|uniref:Uncharacterized protein n=1 Tax=Ephemerocybe angulata TaxID=980116 RepID=A0A8H5AT38_9AGAR|nr:hypothetical protein D9611_012091 [Tulosesus angulatus]
MTRQIFPSPNELPQVPLRYSHLLYSLSHTHPFCLSPLSQVLHVTHAPFFEILAGSPLAQRPGHRQVIHSNIGGRLSRRDRPLCPREDIPLAGHDAAAKSLHTLGPFPGRSNINFRTQDASTISVNLPQLRALQYETCAPYLHGLQIDSAYLRSTTDPVWSSVYWYIDRDGATVYTDCAEQPCPHAKETQDSIPGFYLSGLRGELVLPLVPQYLHPTSPPSRVPPPSSPPPPYSPKLPDYPSPPPTMSDNARLEALFTRLIEAQTKTNEQLTELAAAQTQATQTAPAPAPPPVHSTTQRHPLHPLPRRDLCPQHLIPCPFDDARGP